MADQTPHPKIKAVLKYLKTNEITITVGLGFLAIVLIVFSLVGKNWVKETRRPVIDDQAAITLTEPTLAPVPSFETKEPVITSNKKTEYTVKAGDSLWKLAEQFLDDGNQYVLIEQANNLKHNQQLAVGQKLIISKANEQKVASGDEYKIQQGDCLWIIARDQLGDPYLWMDLYKANKQVIGNNPHLIYPGTVLHLPSRK